MLKSAHIGQSCIAGRLGPKSCAMPPASAHERDQQIRVVGVPKKRYPASQHLGSKIRSTGWRGYFAITRIPGGARGQSPYGVGVVGASGSVTSMVMLATTFTPSASVTSTTTMYLRTVVTVP